MSVPDGPFFPGRGFIPFCADVCDQGASLCLVQCIVETDHALCADLQVESQRNNWCTSILTEGSETCHPVSASAANSMSQKQLCVASVVVRKVAESFYSGCTHRYHDAITMLRPYHETFLSSFCVNYRCSAGHVDLALEPFCRSSLMA